MSTSAAPVPRPMRRRLFSATALALALTPAPARADYSFAPPTRATSFFDQYYYGYSAPAVVAKICDPVTSNGQPNALSALVLLNSSFSAGALDTVGSYMPSGLTFVAAAPSRFDEPVIAPADHAQLTLLGYPVTPPPDPTYTQAFTHYVSNIPYTQPATSTVDLTPFTSPDGALVEHPQFLSSSGSGDFTLNDPAATAHQAIIFVGTSQSIRAYNDAGLMFDTLVNLWGHPATHSNVTITMLVGNGQTDVLGNPLPAAWNAQPADYGHLTSTTDAIRPTMNPTTEFVFYLGGDGGFGIKGDTSPSITVAAGGTHADVSLGLTSTDLDNLAAEDHNQPTLRVSWLAIGSTASDLLDFYFNGTFLTEVSATKYSLNDLPIDESLLGQTNTLQVVNSGQHDIKLLNVELLSGAMGERVYYPQGVPEPATLGLALAAVLVPVARRRSHVPQRRAR